MTYIDNESPPSPNSSILSETFVPDKILGTIYGIGMNVNLIIGSGIVTTPGIIWNEVKSPIIVLLLWIIGGIVAMSGSLSYVELGFYHRTSGGETKYLQTAYPKPKDMMSYIFSFMFIFAIRPGILSAVLQSAAHYFWYTVKGYKFTEDDVYKDQNIIGWKLSVSPFWILKFTAVVMLAIITAYHMLSNKYANYINQTLAGIKLITYMTIATAGIYKLCTNPQSRLNWKQPIGEAFPNITSFSTSILMVMFSYDGWNALNYSLDEFKRPDTKLIYSNSISVLIVTIMYLLVNIAFISVVPIDFISNDKNSMAEIIAGTFFSILFERNHAHVSSDVQSTLAARFFTALVVISVIGTAAATVWSGSRVIVAAAKSNYFPKYSRKLKTWDTRFNTPVNALLLQFVWTSIFIIFIGSSFSMTSFTLFSSFAMYSYWIFYLATGIGLMVIRYRIIRPTNNINNNNDKDEERPPSFHSVRFTEELYKAPYPLQQFPIIIFILAGIFILTFSFVVDDVHKMFPFFISLGFLLMSLLIYYWWARKMFELYG